MHTEKFKRQTAASVVPPVSTNGAFKRCTWRIAMTLIVQDWWLLPSAEISEVGVLLLWERGRQVIYKKTAKGCQNSETKNCYMGFWACWIQIWCLFWAIFSPSMCFEHLIVWSGSDSPRKPVLNRKTRQSDFLKYTPLTLPAVHVIDGY